MPPACFLNAPTPAPTGVYRTRCVIGRADRLLKPSRLAGDRKGRPYGCLPYPARLLGCSRFRYRIFNQTYIIDKISPFVKFSKNVCNCLHLRAAYDMM